MSPGRCEKNWLPFYHQGNFYFIYSYDPLTILHLVPEDRSCSLYKVVTSPINLLAARGSGSPKRWKNGWLILVHHTLYLKVRKYVHAFLHYDDQWNLVGVSHSFKLSKKEIEFSLHFDIEEDVVTIYYCVEDSVAFVSSLPIGYGGDGIVLDHVDDVDKIPKFCYNSSQGNSC